MYYQGRCWRVSTEAFSRLRQQSNDSFNSITVPSECQSSKDAALSASSSSAQSKFWSDNASPSSASLSAISPRLRFVDAAGRTGETFSLISAWSSITSWRPCCVAQLCSNRDWKQLTSSIVKVITLPTPSAVMPLAFMTPANLTPGTYSPWLLGVAAPRKSQSLNNTNLAPIPLSQAVPEIAGCSTALVSYLIRVVA